ncbi:hypothetical protein ACOSQ2_032550 [Xanthoceras sorbifolium]
MMRSPKKKKHESPIKRRIITHKREAEKLRSRDYYEKATPSGHCSFSPITLRPYISFDKKNSNCEDSRKYFSLISIYEHYTFISAR